MTEEEQLKSEILAEWEIPEYDKYRRTIWWYLIMGGGGVLLLVYAIWTLNFLFAIIIAIIAVIIYLHERRDPDMLEFKILKSGILLDQTFISYKRIKFFWMIYEPPHTKNLYFSIDRTLRNELSVPLINMNPVFVRSVLLRYLDEDLDTEHISTDDTYGRIFRI